MKRGVGLIMFTIVGGKLVAVLQARGTFNPEKMQPESYPLACQVTCHGGLEDGESEEDGLLREITEELGQKISNLVATNSSQLQEASRLSTTEKLMVTKALFLPDCSFLKDIRLGPASGGLRLVGQEDEIRNLRNFSKAVGVNNGTIALFPDEAEAVQKGFALFASAA